ncbi:MAG TPA: ATP-binding cassette domain-containing protein [Rectinemataceae bacterium]|nr:ATP-binding cassette domain-containing protein [Rectinemataceae bacterium]
MSGAAVRDSALSARGLAIGYAEETVVEGIDFELPRGKTLALVGSNGSGKTTLLKTAAALLPPVSGEMSVLGARPGAFPARVAYLGQFQSSGFTLPLRAIDVVRMARFASLGLTRRAGPEDERMVREAMEIMGVSDLANEGLRTLSGGQRQRVFIAQALARGADLILLDEPASSLDGASRETYRSILREACASGRSAAIATHDVEEAAGCDYTMLLARKVVAFGESAAVLTAETLLSTFGVVARSDRSGLLVLEHEHGHDCLDPDHEGPEDQRR